MTGQTMSGVAAILLAAGRSQRMGGGNKLLMDVDGRPLVTHALQTLASLALDDCVVVTGHDRVLIEPLARAHGVRTTFNPSFAEGMGTSIAAGARALIDGRTVPRAVFVHLADVPFVSGATFVALRDALEGDAMARAQAFIPVCEGRRGHPVLFRGEILPALAMLTGDVGARVLLRDRVAIEVEVNDPDITRDVDTIGDLERLRQLTAGSA